jgi:integrase
MTMPDRRERTKFQGVYQRVSTKKRNPRDSKPDACFDITYKDATGRKIWEKIGWKSEGYTAQMANLIRADRMQAMRHGELAQKKEEPADSRQPMTFGEAWKIYSEKWLPNLARPKDEQIRYDIHIAPRFADVPLNGITTLDLETFKQELLAKGLAASSVKYVLGNIRRVYNKLIAWELYSGRIPTVALKMPKVDNARVRYLTPEEADKLLAALKTRSLPWWRIASVSLHTGMRLGEVLGLAWGDLDMKANVIHVRFGKTCVRMAHMNNVVHSIFEEMTPGQPSDLVFPASNGTIRKSTDASKTFSRVVEDLKLNDGVADRRQKVVFHTFRHTFASWLAIEGVALYTISNLMGHSSLEMTKRYAHLCPDVKQEAVAKIESIAQRNKAHFA